MKSTAEKKLTEISQEKKSENRPDIRKEYVSLGLCDSCAAFDNCTLRNHGKAVHDCSDFENHPSVSAPAAPTITEPKAPGTLKGLCLDCIHNMYCIKGKTEGGVFHCEEYE